MSVSVDRTFLLRLSPKLNRFSRKKDDLYNFRCPLCGDSQKNKTKSRGYIYRKKNDYFYMCHNCGAGTSFFNFLNQVDPNLSAEYTMERYKNSDNTNQPDPDFTEVKTKPVFEHKIDLPSIDSLSDDHYAKIYVKSRKIPEKQLSKLFFADDFKKFVSSFGVDKDLHDRDQRLIIPFFDRENKLLGFQGRALGQSKLRYITIRLNEGLGLPLFFGADSVDESEKILVLEGPIDSMFLENSVAVACSNLQSVVSLYDKSKVVLLFDNEPRNKEIVQQMEHAIDEHFNICIWPEMIEEKDINDMVLNGFTSEELQDIIDNNTFVNLRAKMEFVNWKKC